MTGHNKWPSKFKNKDTEIKFLREHIAGLELSIKDWEKIADTEAHRLGAVSFKDINTPPWNLVEYRITDLQNALRLLFAECSAPMEKPQTEEEQSYKIAMDKALEALSTQKRSKL